VFRNTDATGLRASTCNEGFSARCVDLFRGGSN
jgi:hypothetical protein